MREYVAFFTWWTVITPKRDTEHLKARQSDQIQALPIDPRACTQHAIIVNVTEVGTMPIMVIEVEEGKMCIALIA